MNNPFELIVGVITPDPITSAERDIIKQMIATCHLASDVLEGMESTDVKTINRIKILKQDIKRILSDMWCLESKITGE